MAGIYPAAHVGSEERDCPLAPLKPRVVDLALHPDGSLRDAERHGLKLCRHIAAIRFDSALNQATSRYLEEHIRSRVAAMPELKQIFIAAHAINDIDDYGIETIRQAVGWLRTRAVRVAFSGLKEEVQEKLARRGLLEFIGEQNLFPTQLMAIRAMHPRAHEGSDENPCPLIQVVPRGAAEAQAYHGPAGVVS